MSWGRGRITRMASSTSAPVLQSAIGWQPRTSTRRSIMPTTMPTSSPAPAMGRRAPARAQRPLQPPEGDPSPLQPDDIHDAAIIRMNQVLPYLDSSRYRLLSFLRVFFKSFFLLCRSSLCFFVFFVVKSFLRWLKWNIVKLLTECQNRQFVEEGRMGKLIAVIGNSGVGKTTKMQQIPLLNDETDMLIFINLARWSSYNKGLWI